MKEQMAVMRDDLANETRVITETEEQLLGRCI